MSETLLAQFSKSARKTRAALGTEDITGMSPLYGVSGNTFRAYRSWSEPPGEIYKAWAKKKTDSIITATPLKEIATEPGFQCWHRGLCKSLNAKWKKDQGGKLSIAHCYKLVDLYIKWLSRYRIQNGEFASLLNKYASCALDSQTISKINACYGYCLPISKPRMGDIHNENTYHYCQYMIAAFCEAAGGTKLEFDYWAWKKGG
ncbi:hypothetical protein [Methylotuvimicrobium buryatense]|uniref:Uncharacterized protein n=1 Tax=Methylotuvimicrobium buryatense TaxID=95641 RepID=A0A4P9UW08_METBY|nr:hypothetical protein [Methylotuvimicrobium buryatense]QCW83916.1 hypothetical protein EQU24_17975 [Methylotuvimicrobium buryatense]